MGRRGKWGGGNEGKEGKGRIDVLLTLPHDALVYKPTSLYLVLLLQEDRLDIGKDLGLGSLRVILFGSFQPHAHPWTNLTGQWGVLQLLKDLIRLVHITHQLFPDKVSIEFSLCDEEVKLALLTFSLIMEQQRNNQDLL